MNKLFILLSLAATFLLGRTALAQSAEAKAPVEKSIDLAACSKAVVKIRAEITDTVCAVGTGFFVDAKGTLVTNFHVLQDARKAVITLPTEQEVEAVPVAWSSELDLAILQAQFGKDAPPTDFLVIEHLTPSLGEDVWSLGFPAGMSITATKGIVSANRKYSELPESLRSNSDYSPSSTWVQTDCPINPGNSGGPLLNKNGKVIGVNTWVWTNKHESYFALSASHVSFLLTAPRSPNPSFENFSTGKPPKKQNTFSLPQIEVSKRNTLQSAVRTSNQLRRELICAGCKGDGNVTVRFQSGTTGGTVPSKVYSTDTKVCAVCNGTGLAKDERAGRLVSEFVKTIATSSKDEKSDEHSAAIKSNVQELFSVLNTSAFGKLNLTATKQLQNTETKVATPIAFVGRVLAVVSLPDNSGKPTKCVHISGPDGSVLLTSLAIQDAVEGEQVFAGGIYAGRLLLADSQSKDKSDSAPSKFISIPVLQDGVCLTITRK
ncbi:MAG: serine protease [Phycisphaerales bacterium]